MNEETNQTMLLACSPRRGADNPAESAGSCTERSRIRAAALSAAESGRLHGAQHDQGSCTERRISGQLH